MTNNINKEINYKGTNIESILKYALIGADFVVNKNKDGVCVVDPLNKYLYIKTVLLSRMLNVVAIPDNRVISIQQYNNHNFSINDFKGRGKSRLKEDFETFKDMLEVEINNLLACGNDCIFRFDETMKNDMTPERLNDLKKQSEEVMAQINKVSR